MTGVFLSKVLWRHDSTTPVNLLINNCHECTNNFQINSFSNFQIDNETPYVHLIYKGATVSYYETKASAGDEKNY